MPKIRPTDILEDVRQVLLDAAKGKGTGEDGCFLTAYQILDRLPPQIRDRLIDERTLGGSGSGQQYAAPKVVSAAAEKLPGIVITFMDTRGMSLNVIGRSVTPSYSVCALYRLERKGKSKRYA